MKKEDRGTYDFSFDETTNIFAVTWKDKNNVNVLSNYETLEPKQSVDR